MAAINFISGLVLLVTMQKDTIKIPAVNNKYFHKSINTVSPLSNNQFQDENLVKSFEGRILFKDLFLERRLYEDSCNNQKISVFIGCKQNIISIGCDLNSNGFFEENEIQVMPENEKKIVSYQIFPRQYCNTPLFSDSTIFHLIPFVNNVKYSSDISASDTMLQLSYSKGYSKEFIINDTTSLFWHTQSIRKNDSSFVLKYILQTPSEIKAIYPDKDLLKIENNFYSIQKKINKDTLFLIKMPDVISDNKVVELPDSFFKKAEAIDLFSKKQKTIKYNKKLILLDFWASWCVPCIKSMPHINGLYKEYKNKVQFVSLCVDNNKNLEKAKRIVKKNKLKWQQLFINDKENQIYNLLNEYGIIGFPTYILIDNNGKVIKFYSEAEKIDLSEF